MHFVIKPKPRQQLRRKRTPGAPKALFEIPLQKSEAMRSDGELTSVGLDVLTSYARTWLQKNTRDLDLERQYPELSGSFFDIRDDSELARDMAS